LPLIRWCAYYGDVSAIRHLLAHGEHLAALGENLDLNSAAYHGHWRLSQFLLAQGADPNHALPETGETPLHTALSTANRPAFEHVVAVLLAHGADPNRRTREGAVTGCFMRDARTRGETPLHRAAAFGSRRSVERLIAAGADIEARDAHGDSPLAWASWHGRPDAILRLLCHGDHTIHPQRDSPADHGQGHSAMELALLGTPHL
jgi:ankyrin repeat protein